MIVRPWQRGDNHRIELQDAQKYIPELFDIDQDLTAFSNIGLCWTMEHDGEVLAIIWLAYQWENRAILSALISKHLKTHTAFVVKWVDKFLISQKCHRIESTVDVGFDAGHRAIKMLGFEVEGYLKAYRPDGKDMILYSRVRF